MSFTNKYAGRLANIKEDVNLKERISNIRPSRGLQTAKTALSAGVAAYVLAKQTGYSGEIDCSAAMLFGAMGALLEASKEEGMPLSFTIEMNGKKNNFEINGDVGSATSLNYVSKGPHSLILAPGHRKRVVNTVSAKVPSCTEHRISLAEMAALYIKSNDGQLIARQKLADHNTIGRWNSLYADQVHDYMHNDEGMGEAYAYCSENTWSFISSEFIVANLRQRA